MGKWLNFLNESYYDSQKFPHYGVIEFFKNPTQGEVDIIKEDPVFHGNDFRGYITAKGDLYIWNGPVHETVKEKMKWYDKGVEVYINDKKKEVEFASWASPYRMKANSGDKTTIDFIKKTITENPHIKRLGYELVGNI